RLLSGRRAVASVELVLRQEALELRGAWVGRARDGQVELILVVEVEADRDAKRGARRSGSKVGRIPRLGRDRVGTRDGADGRVAGAGLEGKPGRDEDQCEAECAEGRPHAPTSLPRVKRLGIPQVAAAYSGGEPDRQSTHTPRISSRDPAPRPNVQT